MKFIIYVSYTIISLSLFSSCDMIKKEKNIKDPISFFNSVDRYPILQDCETDTINENLKLCFEEYINTHIQQDIDTMNIPDGIYLTDEVISIYIDVLKDNRCIVAKLENIDKVEGQLPNLADVIKASVETILVKQPAQKRNLFVDSRFLIPLNITGS